jgi:hypothetical protein
VAESKSTLEQIGLTRGKAAFIGVLAVALLGVIYRQYGGSNGGEMPASSAPTAQGTPLSATATPSTIAGESADAGLDVALAKFDQSKWQSSDLEKVIAYDPFALPKAFPQPQRAVLDPTLAAEGGVASSAAQQAQQLAEAVELMQNQLAELQQRGVHVIVNLNDEYVAVIGDRTIRVGDEINGFIVTAIESDGVRVEGKAVQ